jgi:hypothetical protein
MSIEPRWSALDRRSGSNVKTSSTGGEGERGQAVSSQRDKRVDALPPTINIVLIGTPLTSLRAIRGKSVTVTRDFTRWTRRSQRSRARARHLSFACLERKPASEDGGAVQRAKKRRWRRAAVLGASTESGPGTAAAARTESRSREKAGDLKAASASPVAAVAGAELYPDSRFL